MTAASRSPNGQAKGKSYLLVFNEDDDVEMKAWSVAQDLAGERKLKQVLIGLLVAIHTVQERTGKKLDMTEFLASFITGLVVGGNAHPFSEFAITEETSPEDLPVPFAGTLDHADPSEAREVFSAAMGNLFEEGDEDLWDE